MTHPDVFRRCPAQAGIPRSFTDAFSDRAPGARSTDEQTASQNRPTGTQGPPGSWNEPQTTFRNSTGLLE
ncbi:hypothetical protein CDL15_Pgr006218 [Punica granatum]|uniref:Uncharacterized protein n=1 Tax=Punica granatum TaxID=22663 RepID=A0A218WEA8_PUNGR|nr:hypothetical protein CDL15_Pgr006218 [Punica granatum]